MAVILDVTHNNYAISKVIFYHTNIYPKLYGRHKTRESVSILLKMTLVYCLTLENGGHLGLYPQLSNVQSIFYHTTMLGTPENCMADTKILNLFQIMLKITLPYFFTLEMATILYFTYNAMSKVFSYHTLYQAYLKTLW